MMPSGCRRGERPRRISSIARRARSAAATENRPGSVTIDDAVAGRPRGARERVERRRAVDEHEVVVGLDVGESFFELPDVADARVRSVEVDGRRAADHDVDLAGAAFSPAAGRDRGAHDLLLGRGEHIGHVEVTGDMDVHAGRHIGLRVEIDDEGSKTAGEGRRGEPERHGRLSDAPLEGANAEYVHE